MTDSDAHDAADRTEDPSPDPQAPAAQPESAPQLAAPGKREELTAPPKSAALMAPVRPEQLTGPEERAQLTAPEQHQQLAAAPAPADDAVARGDAALDRFAQLRRTAPTQLPSGPLSRPTIIGLGILALLIVFGLRRRRR